MPVNLLPQFDVEAEKSRQRYVGATGKIVDNKGQKKIECVTSEGQGRSMTLQVADVNKILACIAMGCDGGNDVLFRKNGGIVIPEGDLKVVIRRGSPVTNIRRKGNTYVRDAWVKKGQVAKKKSDSAMEVDETSSFTRQGVRK